MEILFEKETWPKDFRAERKLLGTWKLLSNFRKLLTFDLILKVS